MKTFTIGVIGIAVIALALLGFTKYKFGDLRPAWLPAKQNIVNEFEKVGNANGRVSIGDAPAYPLQVPEGYRIGIFAKNVTGARDLAFSADDTLLVSQPALGKITALPDKNRDGVADTETIVLQNLANPHGIGFNDNKLFVAEETRVSTYSWDEKNMLATLEQKLFDLPKGERHTSRTLEFGNNGELFVSLGSNCDVCVEEHPFIGTVIVSDQKGKTPRVYAKGLRNAVFLAKNPVTGQLWSTEMGRDNLGDNIPPDEINILIDGKDYGWPYCWGNKILDTTFDTSISQQRCQATEAPFYEIPAHSSPLGLAFIQSVQFPADAQQDLLVSYHGSWNRSSPIGYKVVWLKTANGRVIGEEDFITGFLRGSGAIGRPVDIIIDKAGSVYVSDDKAGVVYKVVKG